MAAISIVLNSDVKGFDSKHSSSQLKICGDCLQTISMLTISCCLAPNLDLELSLCFKMLYLFADWKLPESSSHEIPFHEVLFTECSVTVTESLNQLALVVAEILR